MQKQIVPDNRETSGKEQQDVNNTVCKKFKDTGKELVQTQCG